MKFTSVPIAVTAKSLKRSLTNLAAAPFSKENIATSFYVLALIPLALMFYFYSASPFGMVIPLYGFILLVLKKHKLFSHQRGGPIQKALGLMVIVSSFFAYFIVSPFFPTAVYYGFANYILYVLGLFLVFFEVRALKEAFSPLFLVVAFLASSLISDSAESLFAPFIPDLAWFIASVLSILGITTTHSLVRSMIDWACVGFASIYMFSVILVVILSEDPSNSKTKLVWSAVGVLGTFCLGIVRLIIIFVGFYSFGIGYGQIIHQYVGYVLFITWSAIFLYLFSKRETILEKVRGVFSENPQK